MKKGLRIFLIVLIVAAVVYMGYVQYIQQLKISDLTQELSEEENQIATLEYSKSALQARINDLNIQIRNKDSELSTIKARIVCTDQPSIDLSYTTNSTASGKLKEWLSDVGGSVETSTWDIVWTNSKTSIHKLSTSEYLYVFLVFFDETKIQKEKGIFWVDGQCWLNEK